MKALIAMIVLLAGVAALAAGCTGTNKTTDLVSVATDPAVTDAIDTVILESVEEALRENPEFAPKLEAVATQAASEWPAGKSVALSLVGDRLEVLLADKTDLTSDQITLIRGVLKTLRAGVRVVLKLKGYEMPEQLTTDGAVLMTKIAAAAAAVSAGTGASGSNG